MANWLIGEASYDKLNLVFSEIKKKRIDNARRNTNFNIKNYHPILGKDETYAGLSEEQLLFIIEKNEILRFDSEYLEIWKNIIRKQKYLMLTFGEDAPFQIFTDINEKLPEATNEFKQAMEIISSSCPWIWRNFELIIHNISPLSIQKKKRNIGGSSDYNLLGNIFASLYPPPYSVENLAISLAHELGHNCLMVFQSGQSPIHQDSYYTEVYSGVRDTLRPALGSFHAAVALGYMLSLSQAAANNLALTDDQRSFFSDKSKEHKESLKKGLDALKAIQLNDLGVVIYKELYQLI